MLETLTVGTKIACILIFGALAVRDYRKKRLLGLNALTAFFFGIALTFDLMRIYG